MSYDDNIFSCVLVGDLFDCSHYAFPHQVLGSNELMWQVVNPMSTGDMELQMSPGPAGLSARREPMKAIFDELLDKEWLAAKQTPVSCLFTLPN